MSPSELTHVFFDGGALDPPAESTLFDALSVNGELRAEFRELLAIRAAVQSDTDAFTPPVEVTERLFAGLGIGAVTGAASAAAPGAASASWLRRLWIPVVAAVAGSVVTAMVLMRFSSAPPVAPSSASVPAPSAPAVPSAVVPMESTQSQSSTTSGVSQAGTAIPVPARHAFAREPRAHVAVAERSAARGAASRASEVVATGVTASSNPIQQRQPPVEMKAAAAGTPQLSILAASPTPPVAMIAPDSSTQKMATAPAVPHAAQTSETMRDTSARHATPAPAATSSVLAGRTPAEQIRESATSPRGLRAAVRGIASTSYPSTGVATSASGPSNVSLGLFTQFADNHLIGVEFGQEAFGQDFHGTERDTAVRYLQNPTLLWAGVAYRGVLNPISFLGGIAPFAQADAALTRVGPLGRGLAGLSYGIGDRFELLAAFEASSLWYRFQSAWFSTYKLGFTYGAMFRF